MSKETFIAQKDTRGSFTKMSNPLVKILKFGASPFLIFLLDFLIFRLFVFFLRAFRPFEAYKEQ